MLLGDVVQAALDVLTGGLFRQYVWLEEFRWELRETQRTVSSGRALLPGLSCSALLKLRERWGFLFFYFFIFIFRGIYDLLDIENAQRQC